MEQRTDFCIENRAFEVDLSWLADDGNLKVPKRPEVIETAGWLELPPRLKYMKMKKVPPKGDFLYKIEIKDSTGLTLKGNPIECSINGCLRGCEGEFKVDGYRSDFTLYFQPSAVVDCKDCIDQDRSYDLHFNLEIKDKSSDEATAKSFEDFLTITVKSFTSSLTFKFFDETGNKLTYKYIESQNIQQYPIVGKLRVSHNAPFCCAPSIKDHHFCLKCMVIDGCSEKEEDVIPRTDKLMMKLTDEDLDVRANVPILKAEDYVDYPVVLISSSNPAGETPDNYKLMVEYNDENKYPGNFFLHRNKVLTLRKTYFSLPQRRTGENAKPFDITMCNSKDLGELLLLQQQDIDYTLTLTFMNECDAVDPRHPRASVLVWGVDIDDVTLDPQDKDRILTRKGKSLKNIFKLTADSERWALNPKNGNTCHYYIKLKSDDIVGIIPRRYETETYADIKLHLKYYALQDVEGKYYHQVMDGQTNQGDLKNKDFGFHTCDLLLRLKKQPQSEWLCVDFGTSAVVAAYAKDTLKDYESLIDLKRLKGHMLDMAYGKDNVKNSINDEDENLISSTVCFNNDPETVDFHNVDGNPNSFKKYPVWFSPSVEDVWKDYLLPCLKTIIGYKHLPNIFTEDSLVKFKYKCGDSEPVGLVNENGERTPLMEVGEVAKIIYRQLFKYYLSHRFGRNGQLEKRTVNKLVLSVPNTYTPLNIQTVKDLARDSMPGIYPEFLHTISESDAVACYYVSHQNDFLKSVVDEEKKNQLSAQENVLVYDMGAGTLDLTWFTKTANKNKRGKITHVDVDIKGKLGVSKAGNYLDYELAKILLELYKEKSGNRSHKKNNRDDDQFTLAILLNRSEALANNLVESQDRMELKNYVKELKKKLCDPEAVVPRLEINGKVYIEGEQQNNGNTRRQQGVKLKMRDILENDHFKRIMNEMTQEVLENFGHRYGDENGKLDIDVLIFSGRSTSLNAIREGVKEHISKICQNPDELLYADLCAGHLSSDILQPDNIDNSLLKTVVTQGALAYATMFSSEDSDYQLHSKRYYASFGLVKYYTDRTYEYVPLIDDRRAEGVVEKDGVIESEIYKVCTRNLTQIDLVQSYSCHEEEDYLVGNFDTISKLCEIPCQGLDDFDVQLIMNTQSDDTVGTTLTFNVGQGRNSLDPHDDFNNLSLRKSLWPVIFDDGENPNR